jgi:hypothetical protein
MNAKNAIKELIQKKFRAVLTNEELGELLLLFSYEIEANMKKIAPQEILRNTFHKYWLERKLRVSYN